MKIGPGAIAPLTWLEKLSYKYSHFQPIHSLRSVFRLCSSLAVVGYVGSYLNVEVKLGTSHELRPTTTTEYYRHSMTYEQKQQQYIKHSYKSDQTLNNLSCKFYQPIMRQLCL